MPRRAPVLRTGAQVPAARRRQASCLDQESNLGRAALRAAALPAELSRQVEQAGFEPAAPWSRTTCATGCATARRWGDRRGTHPRPPGHGPALSSFATVPEPTRGLATPPSLAGRRRAT